MNSAPFHKRVPQQATDGAPINAESGLLACTYEPFIVGEHKIHVMYAGTEIPESPFVFESVPVGRADLCQIQGKFTSVLLKSLNLFNHNSRQKKRCVCYINSFITYRRNWNRFAVSTMSDKAVGN